MAVTPDTKIILLKVPLELDNKNQLTFASKEAQYNYFNSLPKIIADDCTYQRKDSIVRFPAHIDSILTYNYCMYQNEHYSNKWFYCFITDKKYINDKMTELTIKTDVFQTWQFDLTYKRCFIEREHTNDDSIGANLIDEGLEIGEYTVNDEYYDTTFDDFLNDCCYVMGLTVDIEISQGPFQNTGGGIYNGIISGVAYYRFDTIGSLNSYLELLANAGQSDAITGIFVAPKFLCPYMHGGNRKIDDSNYVYSYNFSFAKNFSLNGYSPRNNKLKVYPYTYLLASNNAGGNAIYRYEDFGSTSSANCQFIVHGALTPGCSIRLTPLNYKGLLVNNEEGLNLGKFPICNYAVDMYTNWLTQNSVNIATSLASTGLGILGNIVGGVTGNMNSAFGVGNNLISIANTLGEIHKASLVPPQAEGNLNCGDVIASQGKNIFYFYHMSIKAQNARIIDDFFTMYGYKTNRVKLPNITGRTNWNYVKTIGSIIVGDVPQDDLQEIKNMFDDGVTLWHNTSTFLDYSQSNNIV